MPFQLRRMSGLNFRFMIRPSVPAIVWPRTVAYAAPATPSFGKPNRPKIMIGSKMMLMTAPVVWLIMLSCVRPVDCSILSKVSWQNSPSDSPVTIDRYACPSAMISEAAAFVLEPSWTAIAQCDRNSENSRNAI